MNTGLNNLPPGVRQSDIASDVYTCECCGEVIPESQIHEDCWAGEIVCKQCKEMEEG